VTLGKTTEGAEVTLLNSGTNVVVSGDPRSGKSWIAGLLAEQLIAEGYQICIIDPEGDYAQLGGRSKFMTFGHDLALPSPQATTRLLNTGPLSLILTLSSLALSEQLNYVNQLLGSLQEGRAATGIPQWIVIDEANYFFQGGSPCLEYLNSPKREFLPGDLSSQSPCDRGLQHRSRTYLHQH
jgi:hypothetical protein